MTARPEGPGREDLEARVAALEETVEDLRDRAREEEARRRRGGILRLVLLAVVVVAYGVYLYRVSQLF